METLSVHPGLGAGGDWAARGQLFVARGKGTSRCAHFIQPTRKAGGKELSTSCNHILWHRAQELVAPPGSAKPGMIYRYGLCFVGSHFTQTPLQQGRQWGISFYSQNRLGASGEQRTGFGKGKGKCASPATRKAEPKIRE